MAKYTFRFWYEWGCFSEEICPCLWADDDFTRQKFNNGISHTNLRKLPISDELIKTLVELGIEHDNALNLSSPSGTPDSLLWSEETAESFYKKAKQVHQRLQEELGEEYEIIFSIKKEV